jgi:hypothetical protein
VLTLYTTPVIYLYMERLSRWLTQGRTKAAQPAPALAGPATAVKPAS